MPIGDPYVTLDDLKKYLGIALADTTDDPLLNSARESTSREIEDFCERQFNNTGVTATARVFTSTSHGLVFVDDFHTTTDLVVATDEDGDGVFETVWATADYQLEPASGVVSGVPGWPFTSIRPRRTSSRTFPCGTGSVQVTARWGWAAVPEPVAEAAKIAASETFALKDARFGVAGWGAMGDIRVRSNPMLAKKLMPYQRYPVKVA